MKMDLSAMANYSKLNFLHLIMKKMFIGVENDGWK